LLIREARTHSITLNEPRKPKSKNRHETKILSASESAFAQTCIGTLRRVIATPEGKHVLSSENLGYTLIDTLFMILNHSPQNELLRETCGLLFYLQESPEVSLVED